MSESILGDYVLRDLDIPGLVASIGPKTDAGKEALTELLSNPTAEATILQDRQAIQRSIRAALKDKTVKQAVLADVAILKETEADVVSIATANSDERHKEYYTQILFGPASWFASMNERGWVTEFMVLLRTILLPAFAAIAPLFILVAPIFVYRYVLKQPLTMKEYMAFISAAIKKAVPSVLGAPRFRGRGGALEFGEQILNVALSFGVLLYSLWNQVTAAIHLRNIVADMRRRAVSLQRFTAAVASIRRRLDLSTGEALPTWSSSALGCFGQAWNDPARVRTVLTAAGHVDQLVAVACLKKTCFPAHGPFKITDLYHPGLAAGIRVYNSVGLTGDRSHVLLTGPNRGGKSTTLKALGLAVLTAQTIGVVFARKATLPLFRSIITTLAPMDRLGELSLFEAEIEFAKGVRDRVAIEEGPTFLMMDEIFHGTNAHDGVAAATIFLDWLYTQPTVTSVISTHYMDLPAKYGAEKTHNLCMDASEDPADPNRLVYSYRLKEGVSDKSSVREILRERGLLCVPATGKTPESGSKE